MLSVPLLKIAATTMQAIEHRAIEKGPNFRLGLFQNSGAGEGNRTLVCSLGSCRSTIELHPHGDMTQCCVK